MNIVNGIDNSAEMLAQVIHLISSKKNKRISMEMIVTAVKSMLTKALEELKLGKEGIYEVALKRWSSNESSELKLGKSAAGGLLVLIRKGIEECVHQEDIETLCKMFFLKPQRERHYSNLLSYTGSVDGAIDVIENYKKRKNNGDIESDSESWAKEIKDNLKDFRAAIRRFGAQLSSLDERISEDTVKIGFEQLLEIYNLLGDIKDSIIESADSVDEIQKIRINNIDEIQNMIEEYLVDYGLTVVESSEGELYSGKYHTLYRKMDSFFDPDKMVIKKSVRKGFSWEGVVVQKERVCATMIAE